MRLRHEQTVESVDSVMDGSSLVVRREGHEIKAEVLARHADSIVLRIDDVVRRARLHRTGRELYLHLDGRTLHFHWLDEEEEDEVDAALVDPVVRAPMPGKVIELLVEPGATVEAGVPVIRVEAMKMEVELAATVGGRVATVHVGPGDLVAPDAVLVTLQPDEDAAGS
jgi:3-methylcrotonyl-CoA carboxylase alpha subunit